MIVHAHAVACSALLPHLLSGQQDGSAIGGNGHAPCKRGWQHAAGRQRHLAHRAEPAPLPCQSGWALPDQARTRSAAHTALPTPGSGGRFPSTLPSACLHTCPAPGRRPPAPAGPSEAAPPACQALAAVRVAQQGHGGSCMNGELAAGRAPGHQARGRTHNAAMHACVRQRPPCRPRSGCTGTWSMHAAHLAGDGLEVQHAASHGLGAGAGQASSAHNHELHRCPARQGGAALALPPEAPHRNMGYHAAGQHRVAQQARLQVHGAVMGC